MSMNDVLPRPNAPDMSEPVIPLLTLELRYEHDIVLARQRARELAAAFGCGGQDQIRLATAVSEIARNAFQYAGGGTVQFQIGHQRPGDAGMLIARVSDRGPGITHVQAVLDGEHVSATGMGVGITGARRLVDRFSLVSSKTSGTTVELGRALPSRTAPVTAAEAQRVSAALARNVPPGPFEEIRQQNQDLVRTLDELRAGQTEVQRLNAELEETNRGVLALYAELDDRAQELRRASETKSRFLSDMSHELRTPLTSVLNLTNILLMGADGPLTSEQEVQIRLIQRSVGSLTELVNDLLDLAKIEAGKTTVRVSEFTIPDLFASLRGICRPLMSGDAVALHFDDSAGMPGMRTDEGRLAQILRNLLSNAIKYTERGTIRVHAGTAHGDHVCFSVADSGIGISPDDQGRIFEDYGQIDGPIQRRVRGTGLGLPLTRKLATLLGGTVAVTSAAGCGSTFTVTIPRDYESIRRASGEELHSPETREAASLRRAAHANQPGQ
jgi:signal transduction histidine kinase